MLMGLYIAFENEEEVVLVFRKLMFHQVCGQHEEKEVNGMVGGDYY